MGADDLDAVVIFALVFECRGSVGVEGWPHVLAPCVLHIVVGLKLLDEVLGVQTRDTDL